MPTASGIAAAAAGGFLILSGRIFGIFELYIVGAALIALVGCAIAWVLLNWRSIAVERRVETPRLFAGDTTTVTLSLTNRRALPTPVARVTDSVKGTVFADAHVPPMRRHHATRASYRVPTEQRGYVPIGPMETQVTDPFGLARVARSSAADTRLLVLPAIEDIRPPSPPGGNLAPHPDRTAGRVGLHGEEFSALREYEIGDDLRKVHWASTARAGDLMVRTEHIPEHGHASVVLDVRSAMADPRIFERMVSATASIVTACHEQGDLIRLATTAGEQLTASDQRSFDAMLDFLALVQQAPFVEPSLMRGVAGDDVHTAVFVLGTNHSLLNALAHTRTNARTMIGVVHEGLEPTSATPKTALALSQMVTVRAGESFRQAWNRDLGAPNRRQQR